MPQAIPYIIYYGAQVAGYTAAQAAVAAAVAAVAVGAYQNNRARQRARAAYNASLQDRLVMTATTDRARSRCYGRVRNADGVVFKGTHGDHSRYYTLVVALAGHEIDGIEQIYLNDTPVTLDGSGYVTTAPWARVTRETAHITKAMGAATETLPHPFVPGSVAVVAGGVDYSNPVPFTTPSSTQVSYNTAGMTGDTVTISYQYDLVQPRVRITPYLGNNNAGLVASLKAKFPALINDTTDLFQGFACLEVQLEYDADVFPTGVPNVSVDFRGAKILDLRNNTTAWSDNPALIAYDWARYTFGGGLPADVIDTASVIASANACDVVQNFTRTDANGNVVGVVSQKTYRAGIVCNPEQSPEATLAQIVEAMAGRFGWSGGRLRFATGYSAPAFHITEDWLSGAEGISVVPDLPAEDDVNVMRPSIALASAGYVPTPIAEVRASTYIALDGIERPQDVTLHAVTDDIQAQHICGVRIREAHSGLTAVIPCNMRAFGAELFDVCTVTLERYGWVAKTMQVIDWRFSQTGGVVLTLRETAAAIYDPATGFPSVDITPNTSLPSPTTVADIASLTLSSGTAQLLRQADGTVASRILVSWPAIADRAVVANGHIEVQYKHANAAAAPWSSLRVPGYETQAYIPDVQDGAVYLVRARAANALVAGRWSAQASHRVVGKTALPANVASFNGTAQVGGVLFSWTPNTELDYAETELRVGATWSTATRIYRGRGNTYLWPMPAAGSYTVQARHRDTSGNESASSASVALTFTANNLRDAASVNFDARNDRLATAIPAPTIVTNGDAVDHAINTNGSADVSFEWAWSGTESQIDGFEVMLYASTSSSAYTPGTSPAAETVVVVPANKRAFIALGLNPTHYYTWAVRAYRVVDPDINAAGVIYSSWTKPSLAGENPYQPASSVAFGGDVTGTVNGIPAANVNVWSAISGVSVTTSQIAANAATAVHVSNFSSAVTITGQTGSGGLYGGSTTIVASLTFTASITGDVLITANGSATMITPASNTSGSDDYAGLSTGLDNGGTALIGTSRNWAMEQQIGLNKTARVTVSLTRRFAVTAGQSYTINWRAQKLAPNVTTTIDNGELRIEEIKR